MTKKLNQKHYFLKQKDEKKASGKRLLLSFIEILNLIIHFNYSAGFFRRNFRSNNYFKKTDIIIFDIDEEQPHNKSISDVTNQLKDYKHILATTKSHQISKNDITNDRYRILFFLDQEIDNANTYKLTVKKIEELFDLKTDPKTNSPARFYFKSVEIISYNQHGQAIKPVFINKADALSIEKPLFEYEISCSTIPDQLIQWINKDNKENVALKKEKFIRILMAQNSLLKRTFLSQVFLAKATGIDTKTLRKYFNDLISMNLLIVMDEWYCTGRSRQYRALNALRAAIQQSLHEYNIELVLPVKIDDGEWHDEIIKAAWKFSKDKSADRFIKWAETLPNYFDKSDRQSKPLEAWNSVQKRIKLRSDQAN